MTTEELRREIERRHSELSAVHLELSQTNSELMLMTLELDDRVAQRTTELMRSNEALLAENDARRQAERRLIEQAELLDKANEAIITTDLDHRIIFWNRGAERLLGWPNREIKGHNFGEIFALTGLTGYGPVGGIFRSGSDWRGEIQSQRRSGEALVLEASVTSLRDDEGRTTGWLCIGNDVTENKKLEERFFRTQRLESIGLLASGIVHDLNNALAPVGMVASLLRGRLKQPDDERWIDTLENCVTRGSALVRQILGFAHGVGGAPSIVQMQRLIREIVDVVVQTFPKSIELEQYVANELWPINAQVTQMHQVLLNLCVNARDAMPEGGKLRLRAENRRLDAAAAQAIEGASPGAWLMLQVEDTGTGIPPEVAARIWEPFFTTKEADKGTGLGLSTVRGIIEAHRGFIVMTTEVGRGTTFRVYLPAAELPEENVVVAHPAAELKCVASNQLVLIVDDENANREGLKAVLGMNGYRTITAGDGVEATRLMEKHGKEIAAIITDYDMPMMNGGRLASVVRAQQPGIKILMVSGDDRMNGSVCDARLAKPYTVDQLLALLARMLSH